MGGRSVQAREYDSHQLAARAEGREGRNAELNDKANAFAAAVLEERSET